MGIVWLDNAWIFVVCVCLRIGVFETCLKVFGVPSHKVDPKGAKYSVSTVKTRFNLGLKYPQSYDPRVRGKTFPINISKGWRLSSFEQPINVICT